MPIDQVESPLWARMMENIPGISASVGFHTGRGANTLMRGGYMDKPSVLGKRVNARRASRYRFIGEDGALTSARSSQYLFGGEGKVGKKMAFFRSSRLNNATMRPRAFSRYHSMSVFAESSNFAYTPFAGSSILGNTKFGKNLVEKSGMKLKEGESAFGPGLISGISAGRRVDVLERKALKGSSRAITKLEKVDKSLTNLARMNNPNMMTKSVIQGAKQNTRFAGEYMLTAQERLAQARAAGLSGTVLDQTMKSAVTAEGMGAIGVRGNIYASSMPGAFTKFSGGYVRGAMGFGNTAGLTGRALEGARAAEARFGGAFAKAFGEEGLSFGGKLFKGAEGGIELLQGTGGKALFKGLGTEGIAKLAASGGGRVLAARGLAMAVPGLQVLATASLVYDLGKMAGEVVKSGINLAKDANRSLQGSIAKPAFGMGYKDTEAAATSRARGVQAIQNSRLNARSALGTEGAMMAAHYG